VKPTEKQNVEPNIRSTVKHSVVETDLFFSFSFFCLTKHSLLLALNSTFQETDKDKLMAIAMSKSMASN
jgi:hypothetical protein